MSAGFEQVARWRVNAPPSPQIRRRRKKNTPPRNEDNLTVSTREAACWRIARWIVLGSTALCLTVSAAWALDPALPPGGNFDLSHWKLTLPDANSTEIGAAQLAGGYINADYFYTARDGAMTFWCPVTGGLTTDADFPRCELREMIDPEDESVNWPGYGSNILNAQCIVGQLPSSRTVVIGQIHSYTGNAYPLVKLELINRTVVALVKYSPNTNLDTTFQLGNIGSGQRVNYQLSLTDGLLSITVNGSNELVNVFQTDPAWASQLFYFKAGDYPQDNSGPAGEGANVAFYLLNARHVAPTNVFSRVAITNTALDGNGHINLTLVGSGAGAYFIQASTNLVDWHYLLITNSVSGLVNFTDSLTNGLRYYRGGGL